MWNNELKSLDYFLFGPWTWFGAIWALFPQIVLMLISVTQSLVDLCRRVRPDLMWKVELKTMDYFRCVPQHDLGYLGSVSPNLPDAQIS